MASYHCSARVGKKGRAGPHAEYIAREGKYERSSKTEDLFHKSHGNMPAWAEHEPAKFWQAADEYERANGSTYREIEVALPRELTREQTIELVEEFIEREIGDRHAYQYAIHIPKAALEKGDQPHAHIMYSERMRDGIERDPELYFKRANSKKPELGGCKKFSGGKTKNALKAELVETRERWATVQNEHLAKHGHDARVDHRSLKDQGIDRAPEIHLGPAFIKQMPRFDVTALLERRAAEAELLTAQREVSLIDISGDLRAALADRAAEQIQTRQQQKERDELRAATFERISANFRAASSAGAANSRAISGTAANISSATELVRTARGDLRSATEGAERRILRSHAASCTPAVRRSNAIAGDLIQQVADKFRSVVSAIAAAQLAIAGRAVAARQAAPKGINPSSSYHPDNIAKREREAAAAPPPPQRQPEAKPAPAPVPKPKPPQPAADVLACLTADQRQAIAMTAALIERAAAGDREAIEQLPEQLDELDEHVDDSRPGSGPPRRNYDERAAAAGAAAKRQDEARREVNRMAIAKGIKHAVPYPPGTSGLFTAEHFSSFETAQKKADQALEYKRRHEPRPEKTFFGGTTKQDAWDADHDRLITAAKHAADAIQWRDAAIKQVTQALEARDSAQIAEAARVSQALDAKDAQELAARVQRHAVLSAERERLNAKVKELLTPEQCKAIERERGGGLGR